MGTITIQGYAWGTYIEETEVLSNVILFDLLRFDLCFETTSKSTHDTIDYFTHFPNASSFVVTSSCYFHMSITSVAARHCSMARWQ